MDFVRGRCINTVCIQPIQDRPCSVARVSGVCVVWHPQSPGFVIHFLGFLFRTNANEANTVDGDDRCHFLLFGLTFVRMAVLSSYNYII